MALRTQTLESDDLGLKTPTSLLVTWKTVNEHITQRDRENPVNPIQSCPKMRGVALAGSDLPITGGMQAEIS